MSCSLQYINITNRTHNWKQLATALGPITHNQINYKILVFMCSNSKMFKSIMYIARLQISYLG